MAKLSPSRRLLILANLINLLVAVYFIMIAVVGLAQLRWYHQLTVSVRARFFTALATSYFSFFILILVGLALIGLFATSTLELTKPAGRLGADSAATSDPGRAHDSAHQGREAAEQPLTARSRVVLRRASISEESQSSTCCYIFLHLAVSVGLILILFVWLYNTGELVRDSISSQLDYALARYHFSNRSSHLTNVVDAIQDVNACCGSLDYTDFPHQRHQGLSPGHYPGSCCGKHVFAGQARAVCMADEVVRSRRTSGCTTVLAYHYDLISLLVVPVALVCLFINVTIIALITISRGGDISFGHSLTTPIGRSSARPTSGQEPGRFRKR